MSINCVLVTVRPARLDVLIQNPEDADELFLRTAHQNERLHLDKAWDGLRFLLDAHTWNESQPLSDTVIGGTDLDEDEPLKYGYGPPRYLRAEEVADIAAALNGVDRAGLLARCDPAALAAEGVYPQGWTGRESNEDRAADWLGEAFARLVAFYRQAADRGLAVLLHLV